MSAHKQWERIENNGDVTIITAAVDSGYIIIKNGYQWGDDPTQFNHRLGCSTQVYRTFSNAREALQVQS